MSDYGMPNPWEARERYLTASICLNGHIMTERLEEHQDSAKFCPKCGASTISKCPACNKRLRGQREDSAVVIMGTIRPNAYCRECGAPFPWTQRQLDRFDELVSLRQQLDELSPEEAAAARKLANDAANGSATEEGARLSFRLLAKKRGAAVAKAVIGPIADFASSTIAKTIAELITKSHGA